MSKVSETKTSANISTPSSPSASIGDPGFRTAGFPIKTFGKDEGIVRRFKPYPAYKDSGIVWMGQIPEPWTVQPVWMIFRLGRGRVISNEEIAAHEGVYPVYSSQTENDGVLGELDTYDFDGDYITWTTDGANAGTAFRRKGKFNCTNVCGTLKAKKSDVDLDFFQYTINQTTKAFVRQDINPKLMNNVMASIRVQVPPIKVQRLIAVFLDREAGRIDQLIAKKERQIELLQEKRSALISRAVTKGLNPKAKMKDSGIEWLGEIPEHWEVKRLKYLTDGSLVNGLFKKKENFGTGYKLVNVFDIYRDNFLVDHNSLDRVEADEDEVKKYNVQPGDIFFVRSSLKLEGVGRSVCALEVTEPTVFECHVVRARPKQESITPKYLINFLNSVHATHRFISLANMVTMATIDQDKIKSLEIPLPPLADQNKITDYLHSQTIIIDNVAKKIRDSVDKLREYRTALISAAVTGKIDVREEIA